MRQFDDFMLDFADAVKRSNARVMALKGVNDIDSIDGVDTGNSVFLNVGSRGSLGHGDIIAYRGKNGCILAARIMDQSDSFKMVTSMLHLVYGTPIVSEKQITFRDTLYFF